ncbi:MAG: sulfotransferase family 2 domain-containing protein [Cyclobacteriaceae bacterium]
MKDKIKHFYFNKYLVTPLSKKRYPLCYHFANKILWYRTYKTGTTTILDRLSKSCKKDEFIHSSFVGFLPSMYKNYFKFAFVRHPEDRFVSAWRDKIIKRRNHFNLSDEEHQLFKENIGLFIDWIDKMKIGDSDQHFSGQHTLIDLNNIDFIGRFETFEEDFEYIAKRTGLPSYSRNKLNQSGVKKANLTLPDRIKIAHMYKKDYQLFYPREFKELMMENS